MNFSKPLNISILVGLISISVLAIFAYIWYQARTESQARMREIYENFLSAEKEVIPKYDSLNDAVAQNLPPLPPDSLLQKKIALGIDAPLYEHGRWLRMEISTTQHSEFILEYYGSFFVNNGWQKNSARRAFDDLFYYKGTSCIEITPPSDKYSFYEIEIWHDYKNQSFSPEIPNSEVMSWFEMGMTDFATCP